MNVVNLDLTRLREIYIEISHRLGSTAEARVLIISEPIEEQRSTCILNVLVDSVPGGRYGAFDSQIEMEIRHLLDLLFVDPKVVVFAFLKFVCYCFPHAAGQGPRLFFCHQSSTCTGSFIYIFLIGHLLVQNHSSSSQIPPTTVVLLPLSTLYTDCC